MWSEGFFIYTRSSSLTRSRREPQPHPKAPRTKPRTRETRLGDQLVLVQRPRQLRKQVSRTALSSLPIPHFLHQKTTHLHQKGTNSPNQHYGTNSHRLINSTPTNTIKEQGLGWRSKLRSVQCTTRLKFLYSQLSPTQSDFL